MKLKCTRDLIMEPAFKAGKEYTIKFVSEHEFVLINEQGETHHFDRFQSEAWFGNWFEAKEEETDESLQG